VVGHILENILPKYEKINLDRREYFYSMQIESCHSHFLLGLVSIQNVFYNCCKIVIGEVWKTLFWENSRNWCKPIFQNLSRLYNLCYSHNVTINTIFTRGFDYLTVRRFQRDEAKVLWLKLLETCIEVIVPNSVTWLFTKSVICSVKSMYSFLIVKRSKSPYRVM
jgi:hypothetical protein